MGKNYLAVQWSGLDAFHSCGMGSIPGQGTKIPQTIQHSQKRKKEMGKGLEQTFLQRRYANKQ